MYWNSFSKSAKQPPNLTQLQWLPNPQYKTVHYGLVFLNLPAPLHYINFLSLLGIPNIPVFQNPAAVTTTEFDTAWIFHSCSLSQLNCLQSYSIQDNCGQTPEFIDFDQTIKIVKAEQGFRLIHEYSELAFLLNIRLHPPRYKNYPFNLGIMQQWVCLASMQGTLRYKEQNYQVQSTGIFSYARTIQLPFWSWYFYTRQIIQVEHLQFIFYQIRNRFNQIIHSKLILLDTQQQKIKTYSHNVEFEVARVYPKVVTPNGLSMYLPREFSWHLQHRHLKIQLFAEARGDYKFGFGAGYVGSFSYKLKMNQKHYEGEAGYCEYVDCRALKWQEINATEKHFFKKNVQDLACQPLKTPK